MRWQRDTSSDIVEQSVRASVKYLLSIVSYLAILRPAHINTHVSFGICGDIFRVRFPWPIENAKRCDLNFELAYITCERVKLHSSRYCFAIPFPRLFHDCSMSHQRTNAKFTLGNDNSWTKLICRELRSQKTRNRHPNRRAAICNYCNS